MTITIQQLTENLQLIIRHCLENNLEVPTMFEGTFERETYPEDLNNIIDPNTCCSNWNLINNELFSYKDGIFTIEEPKEGNLNCKYIFAQANDWSNYVSRSYDWGNYPWETNAWDQGYCSGDDDVDYNSSYVDYCIAAIEAYLLYHERTLPELTSYMGDY